MFNLQGSEIIIVLLLALVVLGPEKLPDAMRKLGQTYAELKKMSAGFQSEFRSAVDEPLRELRDTANVLRDSADFTKLQDGERPEKPKSAEMAPMAPADPDAVPSDDVPTFETVPDDTIEGPEPAADSRPAPFAADELASADAPPTDPRPLPATPPPFTGMSSTAPRVRDHDEGERERSGEARPDDEATPRADETDTTT